MMAHTLEDWFLNKFINYLEEGNIIIMDNASYHLVALNKVPNTSTTKTRYRLIGTKKINFSKPEIIAELLKHLLPFRYNTRTYELDQLANERGHQVI